jgi:hypothetical protein
MIAAHAGFCRRVVVGGSVLCVAVENGSGQEVFRAQGAGKEARTCAHGGTIEKIAPRY